MAQQRILRNEVGYKNVQLFKDQQLGIGAYGQVCKAKCDDLMCAAKIIHPTLVDLEAENQVSQKKQHRLPIKRFQAECALLKEIRHPNVITYLGMYIQPETGLPVLLMELMDQSLTKFLETSTSAIAFSIEVNLCLDIARALSFLHSNSIIHRDLSSNNILLDKDYKAKLTDFGMAKFTNTQVTNVSNTMCPGTDVYMPPEAVFNQAEFTEKGDVFSFGVNIIQILTRKFPCPGERLRSVPINDPRFPSGIVETRQSEVDRRKSHIQEIVATHQLLLLPIALKCIKDEQVERPLADALCQDLASLKETPSYVLAATIRLFQPRSIPRPTVKPARTIPMGEKISLSWVQGRDAPTVMKRDTDAVVIGNVAYFRPYAPWLSSRDVYSFNSTTDNWSKLEDCPTQLTTLAVVNGLLTTVGGKRSNDLYSYTWEANYKQWTSVFPPMPTQRHNVTTVSTATALIVAGGEEYGYIRDKTLKTVEILNTDTRQWCRAADLPLPLYRASTAICGDQLYMLGGWTTLFSHPLSAFTCSLSSLIQSTHTKQRQLWSDIAKLPVSYSTCVMFRGQLLAIGGKEPGTTTPETNFVHNYNPMLNRWDLVSILTCPRHTCFAAVLPDNRLMVVGGEVGFYPIQINSVEFATI